MILMKSKVENFIEWVKIRCVTPSSPQFTKSDYKNYSQFIDSVLIRE